MLYLPLIFLGMFCLAAITTPLITVLHELGHAIPALLLTKQRVTIYIGTYGDSKKSMHFRIGSLEVYFRYNPFFWWKGACLPSAETMPLSHQFIFVVLGPLTSFIIAFIACYATFTYNLHGALKLYFIAFFIMAVFDLFINLIPGTTPVRLPDGRLILNDGYHLAQIFYRKRFSKIYTKAAVLYDEKKFAEAAVLFEKVISGGLKDENIFRLAISADLYVGNYQKAKDISEELAQLFGMTVNDLSNLALSYAQAGSYEKAIEFYDKSLQHDPDHIYSLNNKGYTLNSMNRFEEAIPLFDRVIELDANFSHAYSGRGLSKIRSALPEEGLADINYALTLDKDNADTYKNLGIYYFEKRDYNEALQLFIQAKELDAATHMIDELIAEAKRLLA